VGPGFTWVDEPGGLEELAARLTGRPRLALDTEADGFHAYRPRLCLLQLGWEEEDGRVAVALVDVPALGGRLGGVGEILADPRVETVVHGADYDVRLLARDAGVELRGLWDTQAAARLLGLPRTGLAALAEEIAGTRLSKAARKVDWGRRPLPASALRYAADDVRPLFAIRDDLGPRLAATGREDWARQEFRRLEEVRAGEDDEPATPEELVARFRGAGRYDPRRRAILAEILAWRDAEARRRGRPAVHVLAPEAIRRIVEDPPRSLEELGARGLPQRVVRRYGRDVLAAVRRGHRAPPLPRPRGRAGDRAPEGVHRLVRRLKEVRDRRARELGIEPGVLCPGAAIETVVRGAVATGGLPGEADLVAAGLLPWQAREVLDPFRAALAESLPGKGGTR